MNKFLQISCLLAVIFMAQALVEEPIVKTGERSLIVDETKPIERSSIGEQEELSRPKRFIGRGIGLGGFGFGLGGGFALRRLALASAFGPFGGFGLGVPFIGKRDVEALKQEIEDIKPAEITKKELAELKPEEIAKKDAEIIEEIKRASAELTTSDKTGSRSKRFIGRFGLGGIGFGLGGGFALRRLALLSAFSPFPFIGKRDTDDIIKKEIDEIKPVEDIKDKEVIAKKETEQAEETEEQAKRLVVVRPRPVVVVRPFGRDVSEVSEKEIKPEVEIAKKELVDEVKDIKEKDTEIVKKETETGRVKRLIAAPLLAARRLAVASVVAPLAAARTLAVASVVAPIATARTLAAASFIGKRDTDEITKKEVEEIKPIDEVKPVEEKDIKEKDTEIVKKETAEIKPEEIAKKDAEIIEEIKRELATLESESSRPKRFIGRFGLGGFGFGGGFALRRLALLSAFSPFPFIGKRDVEAIEREIAAELKPVEEIKKDEVAEVKPEVEVAKKELTDVVKPVEVVEHKETEHEVIKRATGAKPINKRLNKNNKTNKRNKPVRRMQTKSKFVAGVKPVIKREASIETSNVHKRVVAVEEVKKF